MGVIWLSVPVERELGVVGNRLLEILPGASLRALACHLDARVYTPTGGVPGEGWWGSWFNTPLPSLQNLGGECTLVSASPFVGKCVSTWVPGDVGLFTYSQALAVGWDVG